MIPFSMYRSTDWRFLVSVFRVFSVREKVLKFFSCLSCISWLEILKWFS